MQILGFRTHLDFGSRHKSFLRRNTLIADGLPKSGCWILDVGSNVGETSNFLADRGHFVLGIEKFSKEHSLACKRSHEGVAFMRTSVTPEFIQSTPKWDAVLLLSVLHRIYAFEGEQLMRGVLHAAGSRTDHIFVEGSTRHKRYMDGGHPAPSFKDQDVNDSERWHRALFEAELGPGWNIPAATVLDHSKNEPHRLYFHLSRNSS